jgi:hypothetical protein
MNTPDWPSIKRDYVETTWTLAEVQAKWGVRRGTLSARATRENWNDLKQQFAAKVEHSRREKSIAKRAAEQVQFESAVIAVAKGQLRMLARQLQDDRADAAKLLKLANALETLQRIGSTAYAGTGAAAEGPALSGGG